VETLDEADKDADVHMLAAALDVLDILAAGVNEGDKVDVRELVLETDCVVDNVDVREFVVLDVPHDESVPDFEFVVVDEAVVVPVLVFELVVVSDVVVLGLMEDEGEPLFVSYDDSDEIDVCETTGDAERLGVIDDDPVSEIDEVSEYDTVITAVGVALDVRLYIEDHVCVTLTVLVTPVGKVVCETVPVPAGFDAETLFV